MCEMSTHKCMCFRHVFQIVLLVFALNLRINATPILTEKETLISTTTPQNSEDVAMNNTSVEEKLFDTGDKYLDSAYKDCFESKEIFTCFKYRSLKYIHELTSPFQGRDISGKFELTLGEPLKLVALPKHLVSKSVQPLFSESKSMSEDSEFMKLFRFTLREMGRFVNSYAFTINIPLLMSSDRNSEDMVTPRFIEEDFFSSDVKGGESGEEGGARGKKKTLLYLLPLMSLFHMKTVLIPVLLAVIFIKKLLALGLVFLPSILSLIKSCKHTHMHRHPWVHEPEPPADYHSDYFPHYDIHKGRQTGHTEGCGSLPEGSWIGVNHHAYDTKNTWSTTYSPPSGDSYNHGLEEHSSNSLNFKPSPLVTEAAIGSPDGHSFGIDEVRGSWGSSRSDTNLNEPLEKISYKQSYGAFNDVEQDTWRPTTQYGGTLLTYNWGPRSYDSDYNWESSGGTTESLRQSWEQDEEQIVSPEWERQQLFSGSGNEETSLYSWNGDYGAFKTEPSDRKWRTERDSSAFTESAEGHKIRQLLPETWTYKTALLTERTNDDTTNTSPISTLSTGTSTINSTSTIFPMKSILSAPVSSTFSTTNSTLNTSTRNPILSTSSTNKTLNISNTRSLNTSRSNHSRLNISTVSSTSSTSKLQSDSGNAQTSSIGIQTHSSYRVQEKSENDLDRLVLLKGSKYSKSKEILVPKAEISGGYSVSDIITG